MTRRDVGLSIAAGILILVLGIVPTPLSDPILRYVVGGALGLWYIGVVATVGSIVLARRGHSGEAARLLGGIGVAWITLIVATLALLVLLVLAGRPWGY